jgi:FkbM family methyltransferase
MIAAIARPRHPEEGVTKKLRLREVISWRSRVPYLLWRSGILGQGMKQVELVTGEKLILRPPPTTDLGNAMEVFLFDTYSPPRPLGRLEHIVDLGANVGYSVLYFAKRFPKAAISAFEPHPAHLQQLAANIAANHLEGRVTVHPFAAGCRDETLFLTDEYTQSKLVRTRQARSLEVRVTDWLRFAMERNIDLLKMDIEGSECDLLLDERFERLRVKQLVLEWHSTTDRPDADKQIMHRLAGLGYQLHHGVQGKLQQCRFGMLWGFK